MATTKESFKFNKSTLLSLMSLGTATSVKDTEISGLKFKVGERRSVFQFEKRIKGKKCSPITFTIGAFAALTIDDARQEARRLANLCEKGIHSEGERILTKNPIPEARTMLKNVAEATPKRSVISENLLGQFVVVVGKVRSGEIPINSRPDLSVPPGVAIIVSSLV